MYNQHALIEGLIQAAIAKGHSMSNIETHVGAQSAICVECDAEIVILMDRFGRECDIAYDETQSPCQFASPILDL